MLTKKREVKRLLREAVKNNGVTSVVYRYPWGKRKPKTISINGNTYTVRAMSFGEAANLVLEVCKRIFGELKYVGGTFREETYANSKGKIHLYPTGSAGLFEFTITKLA